MTRPRQISDEEILRVARRVFIEQGARVSTTTIAEAAGISQAVLFQRFRTKEGLLTAALLPKNHVPWIDQVRAGPDDRDIKVQLRELAEQIVAHFQTIIPAMMVLRSAGLCMNDFCHDDGTPPPLRGFLVMRDWFATARKQRRIADVDPSAMAMAFAGALQTRTFLIHIGGNREIGQDLDCYLDSLMDLVWQGLAPKDTEEAP